MDELSGRARAAMTTALFLLFSIYAPAAWAQTFAKGADVSWITQMEASGYRWQNDNGQQQDLLQILKDHGMNTIRLRVWVNPSGGWNGTSDLVAKAIRARNAGFRIMIDFHYSDSWADPGQQTKHLRLVISRLQQVTSNAHSFDGIKIIEISCVE